MLQRASWGWGSLSNDYLCRRDKRPCRRAWKHTKVTDRRYRGRRSIRLSLHHCQGIQKIQSSGRLKSRAVLISEELRNRPDWEALSKMLRNPCGTAALRADARFLSHALGVPK